MARQQPLDFRLTDYAAIALATAAVEHAAAGVELPAQIGAELTRLVDDLWAWQVSDQIEGQRRMSSEQARTLPSFAFYRRLDGWTAHRDHHAAVPAVHALLSGVCELLAFIVCVMDGVERLKNWAKADVLDEEFGADDWQPLVDGLELVSDATGDPDAEDAWQAELIERLAAAHAGGGRYGDEEVMGVPVARAEVSGS